MTDQPITVGEFQSAIKAELASFREDFFGKTAEVRAPSQIRKDNENKLNATLKDAGMRRADRKRILSDFRRQRKVSARKLGVR